MSSPGKTKVQPLPIDGSSISIAQTERDLSQQNVPFPGNTATAQIPTNPVQHTALADKPQLQPLYSLAARVAETRRSQLSHSRGMAGPSRRIVSGSPAHSPERQPSPRVRSTGKASRVQPASGRDKATLLLLYTSEVIRCLSQNSSVRSHYVKSFGREASCLYYRLSKQDGISSEGLQVLRVFAKQSVRDQSSPGAEHISVDEDFEEWYKLDQEEQGNAISVQRRVNDRQRSEALFKSLRGYISRRYRLSFCTAFPSMQTLKTTHRPPHVTPAPNPALSRILAPDSPVVEKQIWTVPDRENIKIQQATGTHEGSQAGLIQGLSKASKKRPRSGPQRVHDGSTKKSILQGRDGTSRPEATVPKDVSGMEEQTEKLDLATGASSVVQPSSKLASPVRKTNDVLDVCNNVVDLDVEQDAIRGRKGKFDAAEMEVDDWDFLTSSVTEKKWRRKCKKHNLSEYVSKEILKYLSLAAHDRCADMVEKIAQLGRIRRGENVTSYSFKLEPVGEPISELPEKFRAAEETYEIAEVRKRVQQRNGSPNHITARKKAEEVELLNSRNNNELEKKTSPEKPDALDGHQIDAIGSVVEGVTGSDHIVAPKEEEMVPESTLKLIDCLYFADEDKNMKSKSNLSYKWSTRLEDGVP